MNVEMTLTEAELLIALLTGAEDAFAVTNPALLEALSDLRRFRSALLECYLTVEKKVRAACVERDDFCRIYLQRSGDTLVNFTSEWYCQGPSEWAHLGDYKRARTMKQAPELRHTTAGSLILCRRHHRQYDAGELLITSTTPAGADGPIEVSVK